MRLVVKLQLLIVGFNLRISRRLDGAFGRALVRASAHLALPRLLKMRWVLVVTAVMRPCHLHWRRVLLRREPLPLLVVCHLLLPS